VTLVLSIAYLAPLVIIPIPVLLNVQNVPKEHIAMPKLAIALTVQQELSTHSQPPLLAALVRQEAIVVMDMQSALIALPELTVWMNMLMNALFALQRSTVWTKQVHVFNVNQENTMMNLALVDALHAMQELIPSAMLKNA